MVVSQEKLAERIDKAYTKIRMLGGESIRNNGWAAILKINNMYRVYNAYLDRFYAGEFEEYSIYNYFVLTKTSTKPIGGPKSINNCQLWTMTDTVDKLKRYKRPLTIPMLHNLNSEVILIDRSIYGITLVNRYGKVKPFKLSTIGLPRIGVMPVKNGLYQICIQNGVYLENSPETEHKLITPILDVDINLNIVNIQSQDYINIMGRNAK